MSTWLLDRPDHLAALHGAQLTPAVAHATWFIALQPHLSQPVSEDLLFSDPNTYNLGPHREVTAATPDDPDAVEYRSNVYRDVAQDLLLEIARLEKVVEVGIETRSPPATSYSAVCPMIGLTCRQAAKWGTLAARDRASSGCRSARCTASLAVLAPVGDDHGDRWKDGSDDRHDHGCRRRPQPDKVPSQQYQHQANAHDGEVPPLPSAQPLALRPAHLAGCDALVSSHCLHHPTLAADNTGRRRARPARQSRPQAEWVRAAKGTGS